MENLAKKSVSVALDEDLIQRLDRLSGRPGRSALVQSLVERALKVDLASVPRILRDSKVEHVVSGKNQKTGALTVSSSMVRPAADTAKALGDPGVPWSVRHDISGDELPGTAELTPGKHSFRPTRCDGCLLLARDYTG